MIASLCKYFTRLEFYHPKMLNKYINKLLDVKSFLAFNIFVFIAKVVFSFQNKFETNYFEDWSIANNLAKYGVYSEFIEVGSTAYKLPIYPLFLSVFVYLFPNQHLPIIIIAQHLIYFFIPILLICIAKLYNIQKVGILTAYFFVFSPAYFFYSNILEATNVFVLILLTWIYLYSKIYLKIYKTKHIFTLFSFVTAVLFLTQIVIVPLGVLLIFYLILSRKVSFRNWMYVLVLSCVLYSPWVIRNYMVFDRFVPTKTPVWQNIYFGFTPLVNVWDEVVLVSEKNEKSTFQMRKHISEFEMEKIYKRETLKAIQGKSKLVALKMVQNTLLLWYVPSRYYHDNSLKIVLGRKVFVCVLNILTVFSLLFLYRNHRKLFFLSLLVFINFTLPYLIGHAANTRFKLDFEWFQYFLVSYFIIFGLRKSKTILTQE